MKESGNIYSGMAKTISSRLFDVRKEGIKNSLNGFQNQVHRLEEVLHVRGILFINDSRATNVNAAWFALESQEKPVIWIAGGRDAGNDYSAVLPLIEKKVKTIVCLGSDCSNLRSQIQNTECPVYETQDMNHAVELAYKSGLPGDVVLLSPACPSFDLFENYADRGNQFKSAVRAL